MVNGECLMSLVGILVRLVRWWIGIVIWDYIDTLLCWRIGIYSLYAESHPNLEPLFAPLHTLVVSESLPNLINPLRAKTKGQDSLSAPFPLEQPPKSCSLRVQCG